MKKLIANPENDYNVKDISIEELIPNSFENCVVMIFEDHHTLDMPMTMTGMIFSNWMKTKAGIFSKDVHKFANKKSYGKYVLYEGYNKKYIARLITQDELLLFESLKLVDGHLKDAPYMILRNLKENENFISVERYIDVIPDNVHEDVMLVQNPEQEDEETNTYRSLSLFNE